MPLICLWKRSYFVVIEQILAQSVQTKTNHDQYHNDSLPNWRKFCLSNRQKKEYCFNVDSAQDSDDIRELNCFPDPFESIPVTEVDRAAEEAMDRYL
jgi:hypothetical protein